MPEPGYLLKVKNPDDESQFVDIPLIHKWKSTFSQGEIFDFSQYQFETIPRNPARIVETATITHRARGVNGEPSEEGDSADDESQRVEVEKLKRFAVDHGTSDRYRFDVFEKLPVKEEEPARKDEDEQTHDVRIRGKDGNEDCWLDVRRKDKTLFKGQIYDPVLARYVFHERVFLLDWSDEADVFDSPGSHEDLEIKEINPPYPTDPFQDIVNVKWASYYIVIWVNASVSYGYYDDGGEPWLTDSLNNQISFNPSVQIDQPGKASLVYSRIYGPDQTNYPPKKYWGVVMREQTAQLVDTITGSVVWNGINSAPGLTYLFENNHDAYLVCTTPIESEANAGTKFFGKEFGPLFQKWGGTGADPFSSLDGNPSGDLGMWTEAEANVLRDWILGLTPATAVIPMAAGASSYATPDEDPMTIGNSYEQHEVGQAFNEAETVHSTHTAGDFEAVFVLKVSGVKREEIEKLFTVKTGSGYSSTIQILVYPNAGISLDTTNTTVGPQGGPSNGRVYLPLKFSSGVPKDPTGETWPGYSQIMGAPQQSVKNSAIWDMTIHTKAAEEGSEFPLVFTREAHLDPPPEPPPATQDPMVKDDIVELYFTEETPEQPGYNGSSYSSYCDLNYGRPYWAPGVWDVGPLPKIEEDDPVPLG